VRLRVKTNIPETDFYITDTYDEYVELFIQSASLDDRQINNLIDNPYTYNKLKSMKFKYACLWLDKNNIPYIGWFAMQYDNLPSNVLRIFTRYYRLSDYGKANYKFLYEEIRLLKEHLKPLLDKDNIDTIFWARHSDTVGRKDDLKFEKWSKAFLKPFGLDVYQAKAKIKGINQHLVYFNAWDNTEVDHSFLKFLGKI